MSCIPRSDLGTEREGIFIHFFKVTNPYSFFKIITPLYGWDIDIEVSFQAGNIYANPTCM
jgi:hypothetical protein